MVKAIRVHELGGPEVLKWEDVELGEPKEGEIRVKNKAVGLNFIDVYFRKGVYKTSTLPYTPVEDMVEEKYVTIWAIVGGPEGAVAFTRLGSIDSV
ncbi:quinone oxidoreductase [Quercus suber]|uniref:Quinone oxidoreductase n=1 Tax=Quercus suber TaxID=58331 RepID=A0AAW0LIS8_QUESU